MEHYAWAVQMGHLDGPRRQAMGSGGGVPDGKFNCFDRKSGRCIRATDDRVVTYAGNGYWDLDFGMEEGPSSFLPRSSPLGGTGYGQGVGGLIVKGLPWEDASKGALYAYSDAEIWKIWKNDEKGGRWWFKRIAGPGKAEIPGGRIWMGQLWRKWGEAPDKDQVIFYTRTGFHVLDDDSGVAHFTCRLDLDSLKDSMPKDKKGGAAFPSLGVIDSGGHYFLGFYFSGSFGSSTVPGVMRVPPDGGKAEPYLTPAGAARGRRSGKDGPGMETGWFCGPHFHMPKAVSPWAPPGVLLLQAHDEHNLRRVKDGRVSTLYKDGEWREAAGQDGKNHPQGAAAFVLGPNGVALMGAGCGRPFGKDRGDDGIYLMRGVDLGKATAGTE